nr:hypothetical protein [Niallia taxi]
MALLPKKKDINGLGLNKVNMTLDQYKFAEHIIQYNVNNKVIFISHFEFLL